MLPSHFGFPCVSLKAGSSLISRHAVHGKAGFSLFRATCLINVSDFISSLYGEQRNVENSADTMATVLLRSLSFMIGLELITTCVVGKVLTSCLNCVVFRLSVLHRVANTTQEHIFRHKMFIVLFNACWQTIIPIIRKDVTVNTVSDVYSIWKWGGAGGSFVSQ